MSQITEHFLTEKEHFQVHEVSTEFLHQDEICIKKTIRWISTCYHTYHQANVSPTPFLCLGKALNINHS